jgi:transcriptional regulator with XRE-family HTH domain
MAIRTNVDVANRVRGIAAERRKTQADLACSLQISSMAMSRRMSGATPFTPEELIRLSQELDIAIAEFFGERAA